MKIYLNKFFYKNIFNKYNYLIQIYFIYFFIYILLYIDKIFN